MNLIITGDRLKVLKFSAFEASVTMRGQPGSIIVLLCLLVHCAGSFPPPDIVCSASFISEWGTLTCECRAPTGVNNPTITWPGHTQSPVLTKRNVTRHDNGTKFTCLMQSNGQNSSTSYTLQVAYGPSDDTLAILGPPVLVTDGSIQLTLTCQASDVNPPDLRYTWFGTGVHCDGGNTGSTCSCRPQPLWDDGKDVTCRATNDAGQSVVTASSVFRLNLTYPPNSKPVITGFTPEEVLKTGDNLTCTVAGGKPLVSEVLFHCTNPTLDDQPDVTGHSSVSSTVTVESFNATGEDTVCICTADWEPGKYNVTYNLNTSATVQIEYHASVTLFTINNSTATIVANESSHIGATLRCEAVGQPTPHVRLTLSGQDLLNGERNSSGGFVKISHVIPHLTCRAMGVYACTADNGHQDRKSAEVIVYCAPKLFSQDSGGETPVLTSEGLNVKLITNPVPDSFIWELHDDGHTVTEIFSAQCSRLNNEEYLTECNITARNLSATDPGTYSVTMSNGYGETAFRFQVKDDQVDEDDPFPWWVMIIFIVGLGIVAVLIAGVIIWRRRKSRDPPPAAPAITSSRPREILRDGDTVTFTVTGGKPLAEDVILDLIIEGNDFVTTEESVSSSVVANVPECCDYVQQQFRI